MPLTTRSPGQSPVDSSAINQMVQVLTGVMTDQPITIANTLTATNTLTASSQATVTNQLTASSVLTVGSSLAVVGNVVASSGLVRTRNGSSTSSTPVQGILFGSSGPSIYFGTGVPVLACTIGSLYLNAGGSSAGTLYSCISNSGGASSSNWQAAQLV